MDVELKEKMGCGPLVLFTSDFLVSFFSLSFFLSA